MTRMAGGIGKIARSCLVAGQLFCFAEARPRIRQALGSVAQAQIHSVNGAGAASEMPQRCSTQMPPSSHKVRRAIRGHDSTLHRLRMLPKTLGSQTRNRREAPPPANLPLATLLRSAPSPPRRHHRRR